ncbi:MAG TPA: penicillin-binding protein 2 [Gallionellaceae bacterium]
MKLKAELRNHQREIHMFRLRLLLSLGFVLLLMLILLGRFFYLQVVRHSDFSTMAETNRIKPMPIAPNRGQILDRNGVVLARNYSGYTLEIDPSKVSNLEGTIDELSKLVTITPKDRRIFKKLKAESHNYASLPIRSRLNDTEAARFAAQQYRFPGVEIKARLFREYPFREAASHLIGYIGRINEQDQQELEEDEEDENYRGTDYIGKGGIEQRYEKELHGTTGFEQVEVDAGGRGIRTLSRTSPVSGNNLVLTLDAKLQEIAEQAFGKFRGALVAIDPNNGEVLAFVSKPGYDPNLFIDGIDTETWDELSNSPDVPLNNRILRGQYPAGSTIKPFMAMAGLHFGTRTAEQAIRDPGYFMLAGSSHRYRDWKTGGHGSVDMFKAIQQSCDTYFYGLATEMGIEKMHSFLSQFGFGSKSGIDIDGELPGLLPSEDWKQKRFNQKWFAGDTVSAGIGQGYVLVTPMQLAFAAAIIANDGVAYRPHLLRQLQPSGKPAQPVPPVQPAFDMHLDRDDLDLVKRAMVAVTKPGGTAAWAGSGAPYDMAGKTGTAQVIAIKQNERYIESQVDERNRDHAWFIAFAPADKPRIALAVLVENGGHGGTTAAPIARKVFDYYLLNKVPVPLQAPAAKSGAEHD